MTGEMQPIYGSIYVHIYGTVYVTYTASSGHIRDVHGNYMAHIRFVFHGIGFIQCVCTTSTLLIIISNHFEFVWNVGKSLFSVK